MHQKSDGAGTRIRTRDLLITNQLLYQLSYASQTRCLHADPLRMHPADDVPYVLNVLKAAPRSQAVLRG